MKLFKTSSSTNDPVTSEINTPTTITTPAKPDLVEPEVETDSTDDKFGIGDLPATDCPSVGDDCPPEPDQPVIRPDPPKSILKKSPPEPVTEPEPLVVEDIEKEAENEIETTDDKQVDPVLCEIEKKIESTNDFDYMNGDQFTDNTTVRELQTTLVEPSVVDDNTSTKSSSIDLNSPTVNDITECERREGTDSIALFSKKKLFISDRVISNPTKSAHAHRHDPRGARPTAHQSHGPIRIRKTRQSHLFRGRVKNRFDRDHRAGDEPRAGA